MLLQITDYFHNKELIILFDNCDLILSTPVERDKFRSTIEAILSNCS